MIMLLSAAAFAGDLPRIAVYVTGDVPDNEKKAFGTRMLIALIQSGRYKGIERTDAFLSKIEEEHAKQRSGAIDDSQISALGRQFGVQYVCVADITPAFGTYQVSARIINVETAEIVYIGGSHSSLRTMEVLVRASNEVVKSMFGDAAVSNRHQKSAISIGAGGFFSSDFAGGIRWESEKEQVSMPYYGGGAYVFVDVVYAEIFAAFSTGSGKWHSANASDPNNLPNMTRTAINFGIFGKYPITLGHAASMKLFPLAGVSYEAPFSAALKFADGTEYPFGSGMDEQGNPRPGTVDLSTLWFKFGAGFDYNLNKYMYIRTSLLYALRTANAFEKNIAEKSDGAQGRGGHGVTFKTGMGIRF